jgi:SnoaL-like domain
MIEGAGAREREAEAALQRQDFDRATTLFRAAETDYQTATRMAAQQAAALTKEVEQLRDKATVDHDQAVRAEANLLAKPFFDRGRARQAEAEAKTERQDLAGAKQAYMDASKQYVESAVRAGRLREDRERANDARSRMEKEKAKARQDSPDWGAAAAEERQADAQYQRYAFKESAEGFRAAGELYARAVAPPPPTPRPPAPAPSPTPLQSPEDAIASYKRAIETKDLALLRRIVPGLTDAELRRIQDWFDHAESIEVTLKTDQIKSGGSVAYARGQRREITKGKDGQTQRSESRFSFILVRTTAGWHIQSLN